MIKNDSQYKQKLEQMQKLSNEIEELRRYSCELYWRMDKNQDLYMDGYPNALKANNKLKREVQKCESKIRKLQEKYNTLIYEIKCYQANRW